MRTSTRRTVGLFTSLGAVCLIGLVGYLAFGAPAQPPTTGPATAPAGTKLALMETNADNLVLQLTPPEGKPGAADVELYELGGKQLAKASAKHEGKPFSVKLDAKVDAKDLANYYVRYRFSDKDQFSQQSLFFLGEIMETTILGQRDLLAGTKAVIRVLVKNRADGSPMAGAKVSLSLSENDKVVAKFEGQTDSKGEAAASLDLPDHTISGAKLSIEVAGKTAKDAVSETVNINSATKTLLTTDKPMYQPGQTIRIRALSLARPSMKALAGAPVTLEVEDAKGNKVFKQEVKTDDFGISHGDFALADELNKGTYRVRAVVAGAREEKTVTVDRYVLPKFKTEFKTDRQFYQPGETVKVDLQSDYFFGKPVAGAKVQVKCSKFDVAYQEFQTVEGKLDDKGHYTFDVPLPQTFVGQPLEAGKASAKFEIAIIDTADHKETVNKNVTVTGSPIIVAAVPESGSLIPNLLNKVYIVATYADSTPAQCDVTWTNAPDNKPVTVKTDASGFAQITLTPEANKPIAMALSAKDAKGTTGKATANLSPTPAMDGQVLLRTNQTLYKVGDKVDVSILSTKKTGSVYLDIIKDGQTYLTHSLELADNKTPDQITLDTALSGTLQINAYTIGENGIIVRDRRLVVVDPANDLKISVTSDQETYLPGTQAAMKLAVTDQSGRGVASALGVMVVDEAVFALQEMQPGLEKIYFYLEKEIATPRYEIHGWSLDQVLPPEDPRWAMNNAEKQAALAKRDVAARVLLASAKGAPDYPLHINTYQRDGKSNAFQLKMQEFMNDRYQKIAEAYGKHSAAHKGKDKLTEGIDLAALVKEGLLKDPDALDPWGNAMKVQGNWCQTCQTYHGFVLASAGIDGKPGTADDVAFPVAQNFAFGGAGGGGAGGKGFANGMPPMPALVAPKAAAAPADAMLMEKAKETGLAGMSEADSGASAGGAAKPRLREYFPETLYFNPAIVTDPKGLASLNIPLADSITTWRMTCMASSAQGALGSTTAGLRVFQDFFVDIDFPVALTQGDEVSVPVAVYNYLKTDQEVKLVVEPGEWFELKGDREKIVKLGPSEVKGVQFPIVAKKIGFQKFTVTGHGSKKSDAVARSVEIVPNGKEFLVNFSGRLAGDVNHAVEIPDGAIDDASKVFVKVYPGILSQVVDGLDGMLRMPCGCFEQTSSATYPNILVLDYLKATRKATPEIQMKAEGFINNGYQRLVSFEVAGGGFDWFGRPPAHRILTAYGLMEFHDMSKVHNVDPAIITRTQNWLAKCQEADGSYKPTAGGIAEGAINKFQDDVVRNTAYITWALASTGYKGPEVAKGIKWLTDHVGDMKDSYTIALSANTFATVDPEGSVTLQVLQTLLEKRVEKDDLVYWQTATETPTCGTGGAADIEVTGLAAQAFIRSGRELGTVSKAVTYLAKNKDAMGTWQSTQATIQALRAMLMAERGATAKSDATIALMMNDKAVKTLRVDDKNSDVMQLVDLKELTRKGGNNVALKFEGKGALMYQIVGRYYLPYDKALVKSQREPMSIKVDYDRTKLATDDIINVTATVTNLRPATAKMVLVDLGLPPGFTLIPTKLEDLIENQTMEKYSVTGRQIIAYLREVSPGKPVKIQYQLMAKYPLKAQTAKAVAYEYYNPAIRAEANPVEIVVK